MKIITKEQYDELFEQQRIIGGRVYLMVNGKRCKLVALSNQQGDIVKGAICTINENNKITIKRQQRYHLRQEITQPYVEKPYKVKTNIDGFKQWCRVTKVKDYYNDSPVDVLILNNHNGATHRIAITKAPKYANRKRVLAGIKITGVRHD